MNPKTTADPERAEARREPSLEQVAFVHLLRAASALSQGMAELLRPAGLTPAQYNVLRALSEVSGPLTCGEMGERLTSRDPDVTRLLDRLEKQGLITRTRSHEDRRVVVTELTDSGARIVADLEEPVRRLHAAQLGHLGQANLRSLLELLVRAEEGTTGTE